MSSNSKIPIENSKPSISHYGATFLFITLPFIILSLVIWAIKRPQVDGTNIATISVFGVIGLVIMGICATVIITEWNKYKHRERVINAGHSRYSSSSWD